MADARGVADVDNLSVWFRTVPSYTHERAISALGDNREGAWMVGGRLRRVCKLCLLLSTLAKREKKNEMAG